MPKENLLGWTVTVCLAICLAEVGGCDSVGGSRNGMTRPSAGPPADSASRLLLNTNLSAVQPVAERAFRQHFRIDPEASTASTFVSRATELPETARPEQVRDMLRRSPSRHRSLAALYLLQDGPHIRLLCKIQTQRLETTERAAFARVGGDDRPTDTPIDRRGASSATPREEWIDVGRDRGLEQELLSAIQQELSGTTQPDGK